MEGIKVIQGALRGEGKRFAVVATRFNGRVVESLVAAAVDCLIRHGVAAQDITLVRVPGAWEIAAALESLAASQRYSGLVALGAVIRGETPHFDYICGECSRRIASVAERHGLPVGFGVLTCETADQAAARAGGKAGNKGWEAAQAALEMADLLARLQAEV